MSTETSLLQPTAKSIASYVQKNAAKVKKSQRMLHRDGAETIREAEYKGHHIVIRTTYEVEVDGQRIMGHLGVAQNGQVHYHPVPNVAFASAVDLVKALIDIFPDDFKKGNGKHDGMNM